MTNPLLSVKNLSKSFGAVQAVENVDLDLSPNSIHAIIGPNGAGKTTLLSTLSGELLADKGSIVFQDTEISRLGFARRAQLGLARSFQITSVILPMSLLENVALAVQSVLGHSYRFWSAAMEDSTIKVSAMEALTLVGLDSRANLPASAVSHGEQRQLELAMALAMKPKCLLLDEPMAGMGVEESAKMVELLSSLKHSNAMLLIEHDMDAVFSLADKISVLVNGCIAASGEPAEIRNNPEVQKAYLGDGDLADA
ncbi:MAG: ABC transporter ATP-binding protein [Pseudomonadota bacterium]